MDYWQEAESSDCPPIGRMINISYISYIYIYILLNIYYVIFPMNTHAFIHKCFKLVKIVWDSSVGTGMEQWVIAHSRSVKLYLLFGLGMYW